MSDCLRPHGLQPNRLFCPWNSPGKNTGVGCHALLQEFFLNRALNLGLLHCRQILYCLGKSLYFLYLTEILDGSEKSFRVRNIWVTFPVFCLFLIAGVTLNKLLYFLTLHFLIYQMGFCEKLVKWCKQSCIRYLTGTSLRLALLFFPILFLHLIHTRDSQC